MDSPEIKELELPLDLDLRKIGAHLPRPRHQNGWIESARGKWIGHWDIYVRLDDGKEIRRNREKVIGSKSKMTKHQARQLLSKLISQDPSVQFAKPDPRVPLEWFYHHRFKPLAEANWRPSTQKSFPYLIEKHILARFGEIPLCFLEPFSLQNHVNELAKTYSESVVKHVKKLLRMILEKAVDLEYLGRNPAAKLTVPKKLRRSCDRVLSAAEIDILDKGLTGRERLVFRMLVLLGLRPGELFARRWSDWQGEKLLIGNALYRGQIGEPKTETSKSFVWLPRMIQKELTLFREVSQENGYLFHAAHGRQSTPLDTHNYLRRVFKPSCAKLGVFGVTHQCLRRTCSTFMLPHGTIKDVQTHLRHASAETTLGIYTKDIPESVKLAVEDMSRNLFPDQIDDEVKGSIN
jgi:integrase